MGAEFVEGDIYRIPILTELQIQVPLECLFFGLIHTIPSTIFVIQDISVALGFSTIFQKPTRLRII